VGYNNRRLFDTKSTHFKNAGHVLFIPGLSLHAGVAAPGYLQANLYNFAMEADGYWLWTMAALTQNIRGGSVGIQKDKTAAEYWTAIKEANDEINKKLSLGESYKTALTVKKPRPEWRKEDVRRILDMARNSKVFTDKPLDGGAEGTVFRGSQFVVVRVGDDKTLSFRLKSVPFYGYGAGFLIFNPEGEIVKDMIELQPGETRDFTFNDISSGLYALIIDGNIDAWEVRFDKNPRAFVSLSSFNTTSADKCVPGRHFFYVPTGVGVFSAKFKIRSPYRKHGDYTVRMSPLGSGAWRERKLDEKQKVAGGVMDINVNVAENEDGKIWEVDYSPAWGVSFLFGSMIPPFIGDSPSKMLIPAN
jgi:hypothetical protein